MIMSGKQKKCSYESRKEGLWDALPIVTTETTKATEPFDKKCTVMVRWHDMTAAKHAKN